MSRLKKAKNSRHLTFYDHLSSKLSLQDNVWRCRFFFASRENRISKRKEDDADNEEICKRLLRNHIRPTHSCYDNLQCNSVILSVTCLRIVIINAFAPSSNERERKQMKALVFSKRFQSYDNGNSITEQLY